MFLPKAYEQGRQSARSRIWAEWRAPVVVESGEKGGGGREARLQSLSQSMSGADPRLSAGHWTPVWKTFKGRYLPNQAR